jgi:hypothetical protein
VEDFPSLAVTVKNLDDHGTPIPGETATTSATFHYERAILRAPEKDHPPVWERLGRAVIQTFKRELVLNTGMRVHTDFVESGQLQELANVPSVFFSIPTLRRDDYGEENAELEREEVNGSISLWRRIGMYTAAFNVSIISDKMVELLALIDEMQSTWRRNAYLKLQADVPDQTMLEMPWVVVSDFAPGTSIGNSDLLSVSASFEIRRIPILHLPPYDHAFKVETIQLSMEKINGLLVEQINL